MLLQILNLLENLIAWDHSLFRIINSDGSNPFFDAVFPFMRKQENWYPLYLFLLVFVLLNFKTNRFWWIIFFVSTIALSDMTGTRIFKYGFLRIRPCNDPDIIENLRLLVACPSGYGFTSNHAANHFAMATFLFISFRHFAKNWMILAFGWAALISYAQVYVGVHFPSDVICGAALGIFWGWITGSVFNNVLGGLQTGELK